MKDYLKQQIEKIQDTNLARCIVREYLQARTLECLQENGAYVDWAFVGGTALRFLYSLPRFSEDLFLNHRIWNGRQLCRACEKSQEPIPCGRL